MALLLMRSLYTMTPALCELRESDAGWEVLQPSRRAIAHLHLFYTASQGIQVLTERDIVAFEPTAGCSVF